MSSNFVDWAIIILVGLFGLACVIAGILGGEVSRRRERKRLQAFLTPERTATVADIEERRWRRQQHGRGFGGDDNAA